VLVELKKLNITNEGYKRSATLSKIYVNPAHVISIRDYTHASDFLLNEGLTHYSQETFSLVKMNNIKGIEEVIVFGSSEEIFEAFHQPGLGKGLLNG
tara:strand:- start:2247 stop:2537 length:291 start_codon:yes stop_codon:yes gene_type:complete